MRWGLLFNLTCKDISVICVAAQRCAGWLKKKLDVRSGSQLNRHFVGFFNVPVQVQTRGNSFNSHSEKPPHLVAFYNTLGIWRTYSHLIPPTVPRGDFSLWCHNQMARQMVAQLWLHNRMMLKKCPEVGKRSIVLHLLGFNFGSFGFILMVKSNQIK